nr:hypothetical protein Itr_chr03CG07180 [Ipomoea trifida]
MLAECRRRHRRTASPLMEYAGSTEIIGIEDARRCHCSPRPDTAFTRFHGTGASLLLLMISLLWEGSTRGEMGSKSPGGGMGPATPVCRGRVTNMFLNGIGTRSEHGGEMLVSICHCSVRYRDMLVSGPCHTLET